MDAPDDLDVVIVGGGHNALVAAAYLADAGRSVLLLERLGRLGGAAVSEAPFAGQDARLSRFSYLVSLLPDRIVTDLGLDLELRSRATASYSPWHRDGVDGGLLMRRGESPSASFRALTGADEEYAAWQAFEADVAALVDVVAPTLLEPLPSEPDLRAVVPERAWTDLVATPLGTTLERRFSDDLVRGVLATDGLIGCFASAYSSVANRTFLHHVVGNGTGEWKVPVHGMGAVTSALSRAATQRGAELRTGCGVGRIVPEDSGARVTWHDGEREHTVGARLVLAGVAPWVLSILLGAAEEPDLKPVGSQLKINLLLDRLPRLRSGLDPEVAFAGTLHVGQSLEALETAYAEAEAGRLPTTIPGEVYCHTLTDPSILGEGADGRHTLTYYGLHTPASVLREPVAREQAVRRALASLDLVLAEPIAECLAHDEEGRPCLETLTPDDLESELAMPGGHIYHGDLDWPWASARSRLETPAERWGVQTDEPAVLLCGAGARRGGGVSGIPGHNAARAALEILGG